MKGLIGAFRIVRPPNLVILAGAILLGRALAGGGDAGAAIPALLAALFLVAGFYAWNDVTDVAVDRVNRPGRPIPAGRISVAGARRLAAALLVLAFASAAVSGPLALGAVLVWSALLALYERGLKRSGIAGNLLVSAAASSALLYGAALGGAPSAGVTPALFAFFLHLAREIVKDIQDMPGDRRGARRTVPLALGDRRALAVSTLPLALVALLSPIPFLLGMYNVFYLLIVIVGVDALLAVGLTLCYVRPEPRRIGMLASLLKGQMVVAMTAMLVGSVF